MVSHPIGKQHFWGKNKAILTAMLLRTETRHHASFVNHEITDTEKLAVFRKTKAIGN